MRKGLVIAVLIGLWTFFLNGSSFAGDNSAPASNSTDNGAISGKLDKIIDTQEEILKELQDVKAEVQVVKVRASQG